MITSPQHRIDEYTAKGWWGNETLHSLLIEAVKNHPERLAVADQPNREQLVGDAALRINYAQLNAAADNLANQWLHAGIGLEEKVIIQLPNITELVVCYYAASKMGAIVSPVPIQYGRHELQSIRDVLHARYVITIDHFNDLSLASNASDNGMNVLYFGKDGPADGQTLHIQTEAADNALLQSHQQRYAGQIDDANSILTICWTSGTTGTPKGVPRSHNMWLATTKAELDACDFRQGDLLLNPFPLVNMAALGGFLFPSAVLGCSLFLHHPLDPEIFLQQLQDEKITFTIAPPALLNQLAKDAAVWNQFDFSNLRRIGSGSAPLAPWMIQTFSEEYGKEVINFYGSNEGICLLATDETAPLPEQRACLFPRLGVKGLPWQGAVYEFAETKLADPETGEEIVQAGVPGELLIAGPTIFDGYYNDLVGTRENARKDEQAPVFSDDGFFRTGDLVEICGDPPHFYRIVGRCKDIINRGGVKISPSEIDRLLEGYAGLQEVAVCSYKDERLGEKVCVCVVSLPDQARPQLIDIVNYLVQQGIAKYKLPERLEFFEQLPRNPMGKVLRYKLEDAVERRDLSDARS